MSIATSRPALDPYQTVFTKTAKGRAEMRARSAGLKSRQRSILIMLDGQKRLRDIAGFAADEVAEAILRLLALGLIVPVGGAERVVPPRKPPQQALTADAEAASPRLAALKAFMNDSARRYLGLMAADVLRRVEQARDETELLSVVGHWHMALRESKYGRDVAEPCLQELRSRFGRKPGLH